MVSTGKEHNSSLFKTDFEAREKELDRMIADNYRVIKRLYFNPPGPSKSENNKLTYFRSQKSNPKTIILRDGDKRIFLGRNPINSCWKAKTKVVKTRSTS